VLYANIRGASVHTDNVYMMWSSIYIYSGRCVFFRLVYAITITVLINEAKFTEVHVSRRVCETLQQVF